MQITAYLVLKIELILQNAIVLLAILKMKINNAKVIN